MMITDRAVLQAPTWKFVVVDEVRIFKLKLKSFQVENKTVDLIFFNIFKACIVHDFVFPIVFST